MSTLQENHRQMRNVTQPGNPWMDFNLFLVQYLIVFNVNHV